MNQVKRLDYKEREFMANGNKYIILDSIPLSRYIKYQKLVPRLTYGVTFPELFKNIKQAYDLQNTGKRYADVGVILHNIMNGIKDVEDETRHEAALKICALIIVREDEKIGSVDEELFEAKIKDWAEEGYEINGFFHLALLSIEGFRETFSEYIAKESQQVS
jgi:hypothetical protein